MAATLGLASSSQAQPCPTRARWPTAQWPSRAEEVGRTHPDAVRALEDYAFTLVGKDEQRLGLRTDGLLVIQHGDIVYERYARGYDAPKRHISWSVAKSITSALTGIAVGKGALALDDSICKYVTAALPDTCKVKVRHLLEFSSGLDWKESYEHESYQVSSVLAMLYGEGRHDMVAFITGHTLRAEPGTEFSYSTGEITLLAAVVRAALAPNDGEQYAWKLLFNRVGMTTVAQERDAKGNPLGASSLYATPQDYARFGYLYLNDGCWAGERVLPEGWVRQSTTPSLPFRQTAGKADTEANGYEWWLNTPVPERGIPDLPWQGAPGDAYAAIGHWGQYIFVIPSADVVIVRTGDDRAAGPDKGKLISLALELLR